MAADRRWLSWMLWTLLLVVPASAFGQIDVPTATPVAARWYQVELIVFRYLDPAGVDGEQFPEPIPADYSYAQPLTLPPEDGGAPDTGEAMLPTVARVPFVAVPADQLTMNTQQSRLTRSPQTEVLLHVAWRQPGPGTRKTIYFNDAPLAPPMEVAEESSLEEPQETAAAVPLEVAADEGSEEPTELAELPQFEGTALLRVGRYIDLDVDITFRMDDLPVRMSTTRRMKLGELHYLDHPLYGVLAEVTPYRMDVTSVLIDTDSVTEEDAEEVAPSAEGFSGGEGEDGPPED
ncbi:MAG: hypothetical protein H6978_07670 [Gammaproteobacteria bacterium]|nr:hypothetical protein [Gammaproteobacteria bacterium]